MVSIDDGKRLWHELYDWPQGGNEWSEPWGGADLQWFSSVLPRIHRFLPARTALEIAPGFGRWTQFLAPLCERLIIVDFSPKCIEACRERFSDLENIEYHVNDGRSLPMVSDGSIDFVFSFDSLVHVELAELDSYLCEISRVLAPEGAAFLHHSNLKRYRCYRGMLRRLPFMQRLARLGIVDDLQQQMRAHTVDAVEVERLCTAHSLVAWKQELINWHSRRLIDCMTTVVRAGSGHLSEPSSKIENYRFMKAASYWKSLAALYA